MDCKKRKRRIFQVLIFQHETGELIENLIANVGGNQIANVDRNQNTNVGKNQIANVDGNQITNEGGNQMAQLGWRDGAHSGPVGRQSEELLHLATFAM